MEISKCMGCMSEFQGYPCPNCGYDPAKDRKTAFILPQETILAGKYLVGRVLGQGGFGITYIGWDIALERKVAVKEYYPSGQVSRLPGTRQLIWSESEQARSARQDGMQMFLKEARKMARLDDIPGVVKIRDLFQENNTAYIVMDFVEGQTLKSLLQRNGPMGWEQAKNFFLPAIKAMERVHDAGLIHRDLSPDNLMITPNGSVRILDLGAAKDLSINSGASSMQVAKGGFSPLEQYTQRGGSGTWTDVYAMAATIYYTLTGNLPPNAVDRLEEDAIRWDYPGLLALPTPALEALKKAMNVLPKQRTQTMQELEKGLFGSVHAPSPQPVPQPAPRPATKSHPIWGYLTILAAVFLLISCVGFVATIVRKDQTPEANVSCTYISYPDGFCITGFRTTPPEDVILPSEIDGRPVTEIGYDAFSSNRQIRSIYIPEGITSIGGNAFHDCTNLTTIVFPETLKEIEGYAFSGCSRLTEAKLPRGVTLLGDYAFSECTSLSSVEFPETLSEIGFDAFSDCSSLTEAHLPKGITEIKSSTFLNCSSLASVTIPDGVTSIGFMAFSDCTALTDITLPSSVTLIEADAFCSCTSLRRVELPPSLLEMEQRVFCGCSSLSEVTIPDHVASIGYDAFEDTPWREAQNEEFVIVGDGVLLKYNGEVTDVVIPSSVKMIGDCFSQSPTSVQIPDGVTKIGAFAFFNCSELTDIVLPETVTSIGDYAFSSCSGLTSVTIPDHVAVIGGGAFSGCTGLTKMVLPACVETMGTTVFCECTGLKSVTISEGITEIPWSSFQDCTSLSSVTIPASVTQIGGDAFSGCGKLKSVTISKNCELMENAFPSDCKISYY